MKYKVGDKVIVRKWDDMEREFGVDRHGDINAKCIFVTGMRQFCGKTLTIQSITRQGNYTVKETAFIFSEDTFEKNNTQKIVITTDGVETLARLYEGDKVVKKATAKCSPDDTFDFNVGAKIAFERLMNDVGKWRVVHRKPKVGDYIRLVIASFSFNKIGDILKVDNVYKESSVMVLAKNHPRETMAPASKEWMYTSNEFEVVEPVNNAVEEKKEEYYNGKVVCVGSTGSNERLYTVGKIYQFVDGQMTCDAGSKMPCYKHIKNFEEWDKFSSSDFVEIVE